MKAKMEFSITEESAPEMPQGLQFKLTLKDPKGNIRHTHYGADQAECITVLGQYGYQFVEDA